MPTIPKLDLVLELRFYRQSGVASETVYARRESRSSEHAARSGTPTKIERVRYVLHDREDMRRELMAARTDAPVRLFDASVGIEYVVNTIDAIPGGRRVVANCTAFVPSQR